jgi:hypothetical protein
LAAVWLGLPADFLIGTDGRVLALKDGTDAYDQWSVDELLANAREARPLPAGRVFCDRSSRCHHEANGPVDQCVARADSSKSKL